MKEKKKQLKEKQREKLIEMEKKELIKKALEKKREEARERRKIVRLEKNKRDSEKKVMRRHLIVWSAGVPKMVQCSR